MTPRSTPSKAVRAEKAWVLKAPEGYFHLESLDPDRKQLQESLEERAGYYEPWAESWRQLYRKGYRIVRVEIRELP